MKKIIYALLLKVVLFTNAFSQTTLLDSLINNVSVDSLKLYIRQLSGDTSCVIGGSPYTIVSRHKLQPGNDKAAQYIYEKFQSFGLTTQYETFSATGKNVIGTKVGTHFPNKYYVVCGHFDDMPTGTTAPGADDNASGTAAVIELARILSKYNPQYTIKFIGFDEEEQGLVGSAYYATQARNRNDSIMGVINLDMIGYDGNNDGKINVHSKNIANTVEIANDFVNNIAAYNIGLVPVIVASQPYSDHESFLQKNYGAILVIEDNNDFHPYYHTTSDRFQYINVPYFQNMVKATMATLAKYALNLKITIEHFDYNAGELRIVGAPDWVRVSGTTNDLNVINGNLSYPDYPMPATGRQVEIKNGGVDDLKLKIDSAFTAGEKIYVSFLVNILNETGLSSTTGAYFAALGNGLSVFQTRLWIKISTTPSKFKFGLNKSTGTDTVWSADLDYGTNYLVVMYYEIVSVTANDIVKLWINPSLGGPEPSPTLTTSTGEDANVAGFFICQAPGTPNAYIDGLRVAKSWADAPLPVQLASFVGNFVSNGAVKLEWETISEINNYGFWVQKFNPSVNGYETIESSFKAGETNALYGKSYSWTDESATGNELRYRLKQQDNDGLVTYFGPIIMLNPNNPNSEAVPAVFALNQNYPNPFNPSTMISWQLPVSSWVTLRVFNILGQEVATLVDEFKEAGYYQVEFSAKGGQAVGSRQLQSGVYFYKLTAGKFNGVKKMLLVQ